MAAFRWVICVWMTISAWQVAWVRQAIAVDPVEVDKPLFDKPLFRDFMGVNGHTVNFKPELYERVCRLVRDYHPLEWDTGPDSDYRLDFPFARNRVSWEQIYGSWKKEGFVTDACIMFETLAPEAWRDMPRDAERYGRKFAESFGPSTALPVVDSVEIGNEPGKYSDEAYRRIFESMAKGIRAGDPKLTIATCNVNVGKSGDYHKSVECIKGLEDLYDVLNVHSYAMLEQWPTWKRSFPEDEKLPSFMKDIDDLIAWRNQHAPGKEIWLTEFGWDSSTKQPSPDGDFARWQGNTDLEQAQWLVRSFFLFATRDVKRAYIYFFNDDDSPQLHAASGLTRGFVPKPSFFAVEHLYRSLGDYRLGRVVEQVAGEVCVYEFIHVDERDKVVWVAWSPTGSGRQGTVRIPDAGYQLLRAERMATTDQGPETVDIQISGGDFVIPLEESPAFLFMTKKSS